MPSIIAWLDASTEEQRRMRDIISLFADRASLDELGIGTIRDALSDLLFPGTSTLLTRARYLLLVPWCYQRAATSSDPVVRADEYERKLISVLRDSEDFAGLLGMRAGVRLANLPSTIYWGILGRYGILADPGTSRAQALTPEQSGAPPWHPTLPSVPTGFPWSVDGGFTLTRPEAEWLRERILAEAPDTLMSHLVTHEPDHDSDAFWRDPVALAVPGDARHLIDHARSFTLAIRGASLVYNLMLGEAYEKAGYTDVNEPVEHYRSELSAWATTASAELDLATWDFDDLVMRVELARGAPIHAGTRLFVQQWLDLLRSADPTALADNENARAAVARRERQHKGSHARLTSPRKLATWGGASGATELGYRWNAARRILLDIHEGLRRDA